MLKNPAVDEVQEVRQRLIKQHGGLKGYLDHLLEFQKTMDSSKMVDKSVPKAKRKVLAKSSKSSPRTRKNRGNATVAKRSAKRKAS